MNIQQYKELLLRQEHYTKIQDVLKETLESIKFLEDIYMMSGSHFYDFSDKFRTAAFDERQELCQLSSACYSLLRERGINP